MGSRRSTFRATKTTRTKNQIRKLKLFETTRIRKKMGSRAVQQFHRRNPSQHRVLSSIIDDMNKETRMKNLKMLKYGGRITNVPIDVEPMDVENVDLGVLELLISGG